MTLTAVECRGYKAFDEHVRLQLRRLTVLFGKNNSGKTSLARLPIFATSSLASVGMFRLNSPILKFGGSFSDVANLDRAHPSVFLSVEHGTTALQAEVQRVVGFSSKEEVLPVSITLNGEQALFGPHEHLTRTRESWHRFLEDENSLERSVLRAEQVELSKIANSMMHIPGARPAISTTYEMRSPISTSIWESPYVLADNVEVRVAVEEWFHDHLDGARFMIDRAGFAFRLLIGTANGAVNLAHAGRGTQSALTMVTNMIVASQATEKPSLVVVEEPEEHLHPSAHGGLADLMLKTSEQAKVVVETHSENFILRIRRRIAEGLIEPHEVGIYFIDSDHRVSEVLVDKDGIAQNWPAGIFEDDISEAEAIVASRLASMEGLE